MIPTRRLAATLFVAFVGAACASTTAPFRDAPEQPAATGEAKIKNDSNGTTHVEISIQHIASPERLTPPRQYYVVWAESSFGRTVLLGRLRVNKKLEAEWEGTVPFEEFRLIITAEDLATPENPSSPHVMTTEFLEAKERFRARLRS